MKDQRTLIATALTSLLALGITASSGSAYAAEEEKCFGVAKAGENACNSNKEKHACASHSKANNDPSDFIRVPQGSCLKIGGKLKPAEEKAASDKKS